MLQVLKIFVFMVLAVTLTVVNPSLTDSLPYFKVCNKWPAPQFEDPEVKMSIEQVIRSKGYPFEAHDVITNDGYILTLHRIPYGKKNSTQTGRPVVFLQHGLIDSSFTWVANFESNSLGFMLADAGFDVWLGNSRGNTYSKRHVTLQTFKQDFWKFSWDEMAQFDLPASLNYALKTSGTESLHYVGHSQGTAIAFAELSTNATLASKVKMIFALAPVGKLGNMLSPLKLIAPFGSSIEKLGKYLGISGEFAANNVLTELLTSAVCGSNKLQPVCRNLIFLAVGYDCEFTNQTRLPVYTSKVPAGTSVQNMVKYSQAYLDDKFQKYDYGFLGNLVHYKQIRPPQYDLNKMKVPTAIYYGGEDWLATPQDIQFIIKNLPNLVKVKYIPAYNHLDFVWGVNANDEVYDEIISQIKSNLKW